MSTRPVVSAEPREIVGKAVSRLRREGILPAVVYGHGHASQAIQLDAREFETVLRHAGRHTLLDLAIGGGKATPVLLQSVHEHPVKRVPQHVDFFVVKMTEELSVDVPVHPVGESLAVDRLGGTLLHMRDSVTRPCAARRPALTSRARHLVSRHRSMRSSTSATWSSLSG